MRGRADRSSSPLAVPNFRRWLTGQSVSLVGTWVETVGQAVLVLQLSPSGTVLGLVFAARFAPAALLTPYAGVLADRLDRRRLLIVTQLALAAVSLTFAVLVATSAVRLWTVLALALTFGIINAIDTPVRLSFASELVDRERLAGAVTLNSTVVNVARAVGPALAGVLVATVGVAWCFAVDAASFIAVVVALLRLDVGALHTVPRRGRERLRDGLRFAARTPDVRGPLLMLALVGTFAYEFEVTLPLVARDVFGLGDHGYGVLLSAFGAGAVVGGVLAASRPRTGMRPLVRAAGAFGVALAGAAVASTLLVELVALALAGAAGVRFLTAGNATVQLAAGPDMRGRVTALWSTALVGTTPIGAPVAGALAQHAGPRWALALGALACVLAAAAGRTAQLLSYKPVSAR